MAQALAIDDPSKVLLDLAVALGLGGDCRPMSRCSVPQPQLSGPVASAPVMSRLIAALAAEAPALKAIRAARATARERAWALAGAARRAQAGGWSPSTWTPRSCSPADLHLPQVAEGESVVVPGRMRVLGVSLFSRWGGCP